MLEDGFTTEDTESTEGRWVKILNLLHGVAFCCISLCGTRALPVSVRRRGITLTPASSAGQALALSHDGRGDKRTHRRGHRGELGRSRDFVTLGDIL